LVFDVLPETYTNKGRGSLRAKELRERERLHILDINNVDADTSGGDFIMLFVEFSTIYTECFAYTCLIIWDVDGLTFLLEEARLL